MITLPFAFKVSSRPAKMERLFNAPRFRSLIGACNLVPRCGEKATRPFQNLGSKISPKRAFPKYSKRFSSSISGNAGAGSENALPWLSASMERERRKAVKNETGKGVVRSSWQESAEKFLKQGGPNMEVNDRDNPTKYENSSRAGFSYKNENLHAQDEEDEDGDTEMPTDPRWNNILKRYESFVDAKPAPDRPDVRRWNRQEDWGKMTWKEANDSTLPKITGEGLYGVGPVLAALSAGRRELYALYVQKGLDLSSNNRKKKDKKAFERALRLAEDMGLATKEVSKHDLNMIVDNRPHQGLVLDASPLEMVGIKELDPAPATSGERAPVWVALDEVTDPQNLGAIVRSAYFFGVGGVVLCAKNSAPLSGVVSKASAGSLEVIELRSCRNMMRFLESSAGNGWRVVGGSVSPRAVPLGDVGLGGPTILVMGSEGMGLRPLVERSCSELIRIPGNQPVGVAGEDEFVAVESLNVSVAAGVMLNHLTGCGGGAWETSSA